VTSSKRHFPSMSVSNLSAYGEFREEANTLMSSIGLLTGYWVQGHGELCWDRSSHVAVHENE